MRRSRREDMPGLLHSTWSALATRSRRALAGAENMWNGVNTDPVLTHDHLYLMPGWAVKRRRAVERQKHERDDITPFDLHISTSGFAAANRELTAASATQRAVVSIARRFAALPPMTPQHAVASMDPEIRSSQRDPATSSSHSQTSHSNSESHHSNLDTRLMPFWSKAITGRRISLKVYTMHEEATVESVTHRGADALFETSTETDDQGLFTYHFIVPWERLCTHPPSIPLACHDPKDSGTSDWQVLLKAEIRDAATAPDCGANAPTTSTYTSTTREPNSLPELRPLDNILHSAADALSHAFMPANRANIAIAISEPKGVRVISDLDDTIKHSDILAGPREVFRNVFCRPLRDLCVPGMDELYRSLASEGVDGFHMISNSPFELYTTIRDFMAIHKFPPIYSLKLKYYGGRSLLTSLLEPAGDRKKPAVMEVLDAFPESSFVLIGDSGEQDLEVYSSVARERPWQVRGIFIRDITSGRADAINTFDRSRGDGSPVSRSGSASDLNLMGSNVDSRPPTPIRQGSAASSSGSTASSDIDLTEEMSSLSSAQQKIMRRAALWDARMEKARVEVPADVKLVFFSEAEAARAEAVPLVRELMGASVSC